jgi:hypothetical protein
MLLVCMGDLYHIIGGAEMIGSTLDMTASTLQQR